MAPKANEIGYKFEVWVEQLYRDIGRPNVQRNVYYKSRNCRIDIMYGWIFRHYVECKYSSNGAITEEAVSKFKADLDLMRASPKKGEMVTNRGYTPKARQIAKMYGIKLYDGKALQQMDRRRQSIFGRMFGRKESLEEKIRRTRC